MPSAEEFLSVLKPDQSRIFDRVTDNVVFVDRMGNIVFMNKSFKNKFNNGKDIIQTSFKKIFPSISFKFTNNQSIVKEEISHKGKMFTATFFKVNTKNEYIGAWIIIKEINETMKIPAITINNIAIQQSLLDKISDGIILIGSEFNIEFANKAFAGFLGMRVKELLNKDIREIFKDIRVDFSKGQETVLEFCIPQLAGELVEAILFPFEKDDGKTLLILRTEKLINSYQYRLEILNSKLAYYREQLDKIQGSKYNIESIVGKSQQIKVLKENIKKMSCSSCTVLLRGEKGVGKELLARALHAEGNRKSGPFVKVKCMGGSDKIIEAELFGSKVKNKKIDSNSETNLGKILLADRGTLFLEEIGELSAEMQYRLLNFLQTKIIKSSSGRQKKLDVRVVASSSKNLEELVKNKEFREDLYFRLNVLSFNISPLRDRKEDIKPLFEYYLRQCREKRGEIEEFILADDACHIMTKYDWPRNVDEIKEVIERIVNSIEGNYITVDTIPVYLKKHVESKNSGIGKHTLKSILEETEKSILLQTLKKTSGNKVKTAKMLGISRAGLYQKLEKYSLLDE